MENEKKKFDLKNILMPVIETEEKALYVINDAGNGFILVGIIVFVLSIIFSPAGIIDGLIYLGGGIALKKKKLRWVAITLTVIAGLSIFVTMSNALNGKPGSNMLLAVIVFWAGLTAVRAITKLNILKCKK
ncbi:MAG: hypothetical protein HQL29_05920 [Candidatus Omnitrophica bacterium]|nr:hypothetical protein [Candidatus Omnitrophota bacterium]